MGKGPKETSQSNGGKSDVDQYTESKEAFLVAVGLCDLSGSDDVCWI
jgi:hypothetical protein